MRLIVSGFAVAIAVDGATIAPADPSPVPAADRSRSVARFFVLLPDGRVEITDTWGRRVFRWDGGRWIEVESLELPRDRSR